MSARNVAEVRNHLLRAMLRIFDISVPFVFFAYLGRPSSLTPHYGVGVSALRLTGRNLFGTIRDRQI